MIIFSSIKINCFLFISSESINIIAAYIFILGGDKYRYSLTNKAIISLVKDLQENLDLRQTKDIKEKIIELKEILHELEITLNEQQITTLKTKITQLFKEFDI